MTTHRLPAARAATRASPDEQATLVQFVVLSLLLHILVVLVFGSRIGGSERRGDGASGSLDVTLRRLSPESGSGFTLAPGADSPLPGSALLRRLRRAPAAPATVAAPASAALPSGDVRPAPAPPQPDPPTTAPPERVSPPPDAAPRAQEVTPSAPPPAFEALPRLNRDAPEEVDKPLTPPVAAPPIERDRAPAIVSPARELPAAPAAAPAPERIVPAPPQREAAPATLPTPREVPIAGPVPQEPILPPTRETVTVPPPEVASRELPLPAPVERMVPPKIKPQPVPPVELAPPDVPPPAPSERVAPPVTPPRIEPEPVPPVDAPVPRKVPVEATPLPERIAPKREREELPAAETVPKSEAADTAPRPQRAAPPAGAADKLPAREAPARPGVAPAEIASRPRPGIPDADEEAFKPRSDVAAPSSEPGGAPRIDLEATRRRAREIASETSGSRGLLPLVPPPPPDTRKPNLADAIAKAAKPDCRSAYADLGLLAVPPLVASTVGNGGCRW